MRHDNFIPQPRLVNIRSRGRLPHWEVDDAIYFVTFRLNDSLPREVVQRLTDEREFTLQLDRHLDAGRGSCLLREHAGVVANALKYFDRERYELHAWCVMPNHVHVMFHLQRGRELWNVVQVWKSYTSHVIGRGPIWQPEYFDRVIRTPREYEDTVAYIRGNPAKAGLHDWPWIG